MSIISSHNITLYGGNDIDIILRPLSDEHLPYLYKWCADPEVLYWTEGGVDDTDLSYGRDTVHSIYGGVSKNAFCFLIEADGVPIGECWLQKMNLPEVLEMYPKELDVRRIDMSIGEKHYWNKGIGTIFIGMMIDFAFYRENVDVLHCISEDYNHRSMRMWEKHGFTLIASQPLPQPQKGAFQHHFKLTRQDFIKRHRENISPENIFSLPISNIQPSQLYISGGKLRLVHEWFDRNDITKFDPIPVKWLNNRLIMTDGHTRAVAAHLAGWEKIPVYMDALPLDMYAYSMDVLWCHQQGIRSPIHLAERIVPHEDYERLWRKRCMEITPPK